MKRYALGLLIGLVAGLVPFSGITMAAVWLIRRKSGSKVAP